MLIGIDLGSRSIKLAAVRDGLLVDSLVMESGYAPHDQARVLLERFNPRRIIATGYGRHLAQKHLSGEVITEIKAHALGARYYAPDCTTVLDVGGQDSKVINLDGNGKVSNFQMNDKCAAGTGRFLEIMAATLGYTLDEFGPAALAATHDMTIGSMCAVFAESEVISLKNRGMLPQDIARAVHLSVVERLVAMLNKAGYGRRLLFSGGAAKNPALVQFLRQRLDVEISVPPQPEIIGALGAAVYAGIVQEREDLTARG